jgi:hypothetical protein
MHVAVVLSGLPLDLALLYLLLLLLLPRLDLKGAACMLQ